MTAATPSRFGSANGGSDKTELFLKIFGGEILTQFHKKTVFLDKNIVRTISSGKSAQFPASGLATAAYHTPGAELTGNAIDHAEMTITVDDLLVAHAFIAKIDEAMNHYDVRSIYSGELSDALSQVYDANVAQNIILAARASSPISAITLPTRVFTDSTYRTDGEALAAGIFKGAQALDEGNVSDNERYVGVKPAQFYLLGQTTKVLNKDWGGAGSYSAGTVAPIAGCMVVKTNNLPSTNVNSGPSAYQGNFTNTAAVVWQKGAVGTLKLLDLNTEVAPDPRRRGTLMIAEYAMGHGKLRPECAVELKVA